MSDSLKDYGDAMERRKDEMMERQNKDLLLEGLENGNKSLCQEINRLRDVIDDAFNALKENKTDAALKVLEDAFDR